MTFVMTNSITRSIVRAAAPPPESARMEAQCSQRGIFVGIPEHPGARGGREARTVHGLAGGGVQGARKAPLGPYRELGRGAAPTQA